MSIISPTLQGYDRWRQVQAERDLGVRTAGAGVIYQQDRVTPVERFARLYREDGFDAGATDQRRSFVQTGKSARPAASGRRVAVFEARTGLAGRSTPDVKAASGASAAAYSRVRAKDAFECPQPTLVALSGPLTWTQSPAIPNAPAGSARDPLTFRAELGDLSSAV